MQHIVSITADCDRDALTVLVQKDGPACHLGTDSCFEYPVWESEDLHPFSLEGLIEQLVGRKEEKKEGSYTAAGMEFYVIPTPGHTPGSVCYIFDGMMFTGDTLFKGSIGTTDFGGDEEALTKSLRALYDLPGDYTVYPGHGSATTLSDERRTNPYLTRFAKK